MWFSSLVWLSAAVLLTLFNYELLSASNPGMLVCVTLFLSLFFIPFSFLRWCLVKSKRVSVEFENVAISTNRVNPILKGKIDTPREINEILDSNGPKIEFYDKNNQPNVGVNHDTSEKRTVWQDDEFPRGPSIIVLLIFTFVSWACGLLCVFLFEQNILERSQDDYEAMLLYGVLGVLVFGYFFSVIKIGISSLIITNCRVNMCLRRVIVDSLTLKIAQDLGSLTVRPD